MVFRSFFKFYIYIYIFCLSTLNKILKPFYDLLTVIIIHLSLVDWIKKLVGRLHCGLPTLALNTTTFRTLRMLFSALAVGHLVIFLLWSVKLKLLELRVSVSADNTAAPLGC